MFSGMIGYALTPYRRLADQWDYEADEAIKELERQQGREFSEPERAIFGKRGEHRSALPGGSRWGDVKAASTNIGEVLTSHKRPRPTVV
jgi:type I restriction enzyme M protein